MDITGNSVQDPNYVLRFAIILFMGVVSFGSVMFWRGETLFAAEYQEMPVSHEQLQVKKQNNAKKISLQEKLIQTADE